jgi:hypothetical protein
MHEVVLEYMFSPMFFGFPLLIIIPLLFRTHLSQPSQLRIVLTRLWSKDFRFLSHYDL